MAKIKQEFVDRITDLQRRSGNDLVDIISAFSGKPRREGASYKTSCPLCGSDHGLTITPNKNVFKCFACNDLQGKDPLAYLMTGQRMTFPEAIEWLASYYHEVVEYEQGREPSQKKTDKTFCRRMLDESGLTRKDVSATLAVDEDGKVVTRPTFISATLDKDGQIDESGDDAVILYYDLDGRAVTFVTEVGKKQVEKPYYRVRYQFPDKHLDKNRRPIKYRSPMGSPTFIYYPEAIRAAYKAKATIDTLYIQEGEKKAEKACKHGIMSVAVSGIQNIGYRGSLPEEIVTLIETCQVKEVIFMLDADCFDLTHTLTVSDPVERRPSNFYNAIRNYKEYFQKLKNHNIYIELFFGYILRESTPDKGTDDLLANTLKGREEELLKDLQTARNEKSGRGQWVQLHKITTLTDAQIMKFWALQSPQDFCKRYITELSALPEFTFGRRRWRYNEAGELESAQPLQDDETFWSVTTRKSTGEKFYNFCYVGAKKFLERRGFWRWKRPDGEYEYVHVKDATVQVVKHHEIADFVKSFTQDTLPKPVLEMLLKGGVQYLGPASLTMLDYLREEFEQPRRGVQRMYFANEIWEITADGIKALKYSQQRLNIWKHQKKDHNVALLPPLVNITRLENGSWTYTLSADGRRCDFLRFLENASNFTWRKDEVTPEERLANAQHLVSKLAALGYLCASAKEASFSKAVIAMDGKQSEIGRSDGRSGKSLLGKAVGQVVQAKYYNGKAFAAQNNQFIWDGVDERTKLVNIDDCQKDFDFEDLFGLITGDWPVNPKGAKPYSLPYSVSPKVYVTTNHAVTGDGSSYTDRQWLLAFSDYYNAEHKPEHDFKTYFFEGWDTEQWDLFWNLVAQCIQIYFLHGYIGVPGDRLEKRKLLQELGDEFIEWADVYYSKDGEHFGKQLKRPDIYQSLLDHVGPKRATFYSARVFKSKLIKYCEYRDLIYNPDRYDPIRKRYTTLDKDGRPVRDDKSNGMEYITISDISFYPPALFDEEPIDLDIPMDSDDLPI